MTPWSTEVELVADVDDINGGEDLVRVQLLLSTDPGPMREFRHFLSVDLDEAHAAELFGKLGLALRRLREGGQP